MVTLGNIDDRLLLYIHLLEPPRVSPPVPLDGVRIFIYDSLSQHLKIIQQVHIDQKMKKSKHIYQKIICSIKCMWQNAFICIEEEIL